MKTEYLSRFSGYVKAEREQGIDC